ncbi:MFS transporter [Halocalculus aciditolerans]|uniref:MFS transporter n=1 Tax=Halocalculus aciditolerans TaxID=1383812 RepID=A0A830F2C5_9EURY|nr:MFS transporter [Halocalculus aciditolerans]GGL55631.1 MFS transporter [Halocalculus aciditolerans]
MTERDASPVRQFVSLERDVLVLSAAMFAFSLGFQMTGRYLPKYLAVLGAGAGVVGLYGSLGNLISAVYPYPGGVLSDRIGSSRALTLFGALSALGFLAWYAAPAAGDLAILVVFCGLLLAQCWKSFGLGATFALVKASVEPDRLARGFASTEVFRRVGFLAGPLLAAAVLAWTTDFLAGFRVVLLVGAVVAVAATVAQYVLYDASDEPVGKSIESLRDVVDDLRALPSELRPLLVADTLVRWGNGMAYVFVVLVVTDYLDVGFAAVGVTLSPESFFGVLLAVEMAVALASMLPVSRLADGLGLKPVVALGFAVYGVFPVLLVFAPANQWVLVALFAFSGLRFAGLPAHKALIVGPAARGAGGRTTGAYYLVRNVVTVPAPVVGGVLYAGDPRLAFAAASAVALAGVAYFIYYGERFDAAAASAGSP